MNIRLHIALNAEPAQVERLLQLQQAFAAVCNALAPQVASTRCWNRVALHHMAYKSMREQFPEMGSQMICNAIYSVSRTSRLLYQHAASPYSLAKLGDRPLPVLRYAETLPVYFDRHTLSLKDGKLSMYTLDGRMRFHLNLDAEDENNFKNKKLREIVLLRNDVGQFGLSFWFTDEAEGVDVEADPGEPASDLDIPEYVLVQEIQ